MKSVILLAAFALIVMTVLPALAVPLDGDIEDPASAVTSDAGANNSTTSVIKRPRRLWITGSTGQDYWDDNCDFPGYDFGFITSAKSECGQICANTYSPKLCTHYSWVKNSCAVKNIPAGMYETSTSGVSCGFIRGRSNQPYP